MMGSTDSTIQLVDFVIEAFFSFDASITNDIGHYNQIPRLFLNYPLIQFLADWMIKEQNTMMTLDAGSYTSGWGGGTMHSNRIGRE